MCKIFGAGAAAITILFAATAALGQSSAENRAEIAKGLKQTPVFVVLEGHYPDTFKAAVDIVEKGMAEGRTMRDMQNQVRSIYGDLLQKQIPLAEDGLVVEAINLTIAQAEAAASPKDCMALLGDGQFDRIGQLVVPPHLIAREQDWASKLLLQVAQKPVRRKLAAPAPALVEEMAAVAYDSLPSDDSRKRINRIGGNFAAATDPADQRAICEFTITFFRAIADRPVSEASATFLGLSFVD